MHEFFNRFRKADKAVASLEMLGERTPLFFDEFNNWVRAGFKSPPPLGIKWEVLSRWSNSEHWIETGTLWGETTEFLSKKNISVITIEGSKEISDKAISKFADNDFVEVIHGLSEEKIDLAITKSLGKGAKSICFWLDGHYSGPGTHQGPIDTPIISELTAIGLRLNEFTHATVFVDDIRLFNVGNTKHQDYPNLEQLIDWALQNKMYWTIELDIFIATNDFSKFSTYANG